MKQRLNGWQNITLQYDNFEKEAQDAIKGIIEIDHLGRNVTRYNRVRNDLTRMVKAAFFAGRQQVLDEINNADDQPDTLLLGFCGCGATTCTDVWFRNVGKFTQGSGFSLPEAIRLKKGWDKPTGYTPVEGNPIELAIDEVRRAFNAEDASSPIGQARIDAAMQRVHSLRGTTPQPESYIDLEQVEAAI